MRQTKAKKLKRYIFRDDSPKLRIYIQMPNGQILNRAHMYKTRDAGNRILELPKRTLYRLLKRTKGEGVTI